MFSFIFYHSQVRHSYFVLRQSPSAAKPFLLRQWVLHMFTFIQIKLGSFKNRSKTVYLARSQDVFFSQDDQVIRQTIELQVCLSYLQNECYIKTC